MGLAVSTQTALPLIRCGQAAVCLVVSRWRPAPARAPRSARESTVRGVEHEAGEDAASDGVAEKVARDAGVAAVAVNGHPRRIGQDRGHADGEVRGCPEYRGEQPGLGAGRHAASGGGCAERGTQSRHDTGWQQVAGDTLGGNGRGQGRSGPECAANQRTGECPPQRARSAARAERFPERTAANVATASTRVPAAVASEAIVAHSIGVIRRSLAQPGPLPECAKPCVQRPAFTPGWSGRRRRPPTGRGRALWRGR